MPDQKQEQVQGVANLTCRNHPTYRWVHTKYTLPGHRRTFIGRGVLMFEGEEGGKPSHPLFNMCESRLNSEAPPEFAARYHENYTPECDCPWSDLVFHSWVSE